MKTIEIDFRQLPLLVKIRRNNVIKEYQLTPSSRKLAACLSCIKDPSATN